MLYVIDYNIPYRFNIIELCRFIFLGVFLSA